MEDAPVVDEVVTQKSSLFVVTTLSKTLAVILFIIMPFVGGYIGYKISHSTVATSEIEVSNKIDTTIASEPKVLRVRGESMPSRFLAYWCNESDINCLQHKSSIPNDSINVTALYAESATSTYLLDLLYISESTSKAYFRTANEKDEVVGVVGFDMNTKSITKADELYGEFETEDPDIDVQQLEKNNTTDSSTTPSLEIVSLLYPSLTYRINDAIDSGATLRLIDVPSNLSVWDTQDIVIGTNEINLTGLLEPGTYLLRIETFTNGSGKTLAESATFTIQGSVVPIPTCAITENKATNSRLFTWTSKNADVAYLTHSLGMGGSAILFGLEYGKKVSMDGTETVSHVNDDGYWLVVKNARGATACSPDGTTYFDSQKEIDNPFIMG